MTHIFNDTSDKMLAAIDYTISRYGHEPWLPAALRLATTKYLISGDDRVEPLTIFKVKDGGYGYTGYHYIIDAIEKYNVNVINYYSYKYLSLFLFIMIILFLFLR